MPRKIGNLVVADLTKRSAEGLAFAKKILRSEKMDHPKLRDALEYYLENWGDFAHPGLFSIACEIVGGKSIDALDAQASLAMMAAAFDIHDDIIDKSEMKHEKLTIYGKFGLEISILLGNAFMIEGFKLFVDSTRALPKEREEIALDRLKSLLFEVGNAHAIEIGFKKSNSKKVADYMNIIEMKAAGIEADMFFGALFGKGSDNEVETLSKIGRNLGVLITLREDFIDVFDVEELNQRIASHDLPLPLLAAMQDNNASKKIQKKLLKKNLSEDEIEALLDSTLESKPVLLIKEKMKLLIGECIRLSTAFQNMKLQRKLQALASLMLEDL